MYKILICFLPLMAYAEEQSFISMYPGSRVRSQGSQAFDEINVPVSPIKKEAFAKILHLEGKLTWVNYEFPENRSTLEVYKNYEISLQKAGFQFLFSCSPKDCGEGHKTLRGVGEYNASDRGGSDFRYLVAKLTREKEGDVYVTVLLRADHNRSKVYNRVLNVASIEMKPMQEGLVAVNAAVLAEDLKNSGHASVYGILFDLDKAEIRAESWPALDEIAKLLKQNNDLKLYVVGHTDNAGTFEHNMELSKRRAVAVANSLTTKYSIEATRLRADGIGPLSPVNTNRTEQGRAKNRRVELVEQ